MCDCNSCQCNGGSFCVARYIGPRGPRGLQGNTGATGSVGPEGPVGPQGEPGSSYPSWSFENLIGRTYYLDEEPFTTDYSDIPEIDVVSGDTHYSYNALTPIDPPPGYVLDTTIGIKLPAGLPVGTQVHIYNVYSATIIIYAPFTVTPGDSSELFSAPGLPEQMNLDAYTQEAVLTKISTTQWLNIIS